MEGILPAVISSIISGSQDTALEHLVLKFYKFCYKLLER